MFDVTLQQAKQDEFLLSEKLRKTAQWMMSVAGMPEFKERQDAYFPILRDWRAARKKLIEMESKAITVNRCPAYTKSESAIALEEKRALKEATVTSSTYERAQRKLFKDVNGFVCGK